jgi:hypothetical protein
LAEPAVRIVRTHRRLGGKGFELRCIDCMSPDERRLYAGAAEMGELEDMDDERPLTDVERQRLAKRGFGDFGLEAEDE